MLIDSVSPSLPPHRLWMTLWSSATKARKCWSEGADEFSAPSGWVMERIAIPALTTDSGTLSILDLVGSAAALPSGSACRCPYWPGSGARLRRPGQPARCPGRASADLVPDKTNVSEIPSEWAAPRLQ